MGLFQKQYFEVIINISVFLRFESYIEKHQFIKSLKEEKHKYKKVDFHINFRTKPFKFLKIILIFLFFVFFLFFSIFFSVRFNPDNLINTMPWNQENYYKCFKKNISEEKYDSDWQNVLNFFNNFPLKSPTSEQLKDETFDLMSNFPEFYSYYSVFQDSRICLCYSIDNRQFLISKSLRKDKCKKYMEKYSPFKITFGIGILFSLLFLSIILFISIQVFFKYTKFKNNTNHKYLLTLSTFCFNSIFIYVTF